MMLVSALRSSTGARPPLGWGGGLGNTGSISSQSLSLTNDLDICLSLMTNLKIVSFSCAIHL